MHCIKSHIIAVLFFVSALITGCHVNSTEPKDANPENPPSNKGKQTNWFIKNDARLLPSGFVINMDNDSYYQQNDFKRIASYGSNIVVIRVGIGHLGGWPGYNLDQQYLNKLDAYVDNASKAGLSVIFKMTIYDIRGKNKVQNIWGKLFKNKNKEQKNYLEGWQKLWTKYANNVAVLGYDLINEPHAGENTNKTDQEITQTQLMPLYNDLVNSLKAISPNKWALYQPLTKSNRKQGELAFAKLRGTINYKNSVYAPHAYYNNTLMLRRAIDRYKKDAKSSNSKLMMGEWGRSTPASADSSLREQQEYYRLYAESAALYDQNEIGAIKAWFRGTPSFIHHDGRVFTWSIFSDTTEVGTTERKYIVDAINRPKPLYSNSPVENYGFNFATRIFNMSFEEKDLPGTTEIFVPERHYPDGFTIEINDIRLVRDQNSEGGLRVVKGSSRQLVPSSFSYDDKNHRLLINGWDNQTQNNKLKIVPGIFD